MRRYFVSGFPSALPSLSHAKEKSSGVEIARLLVKKFTIEQQTRPQHCQHWDLNARFFSNRVCHLL